MENQIVPVVASVVFPSPCHQIRSFFDLKPPHQPQTPDSNKSRPKSSADSDFPTSKQVKQHHANHCRQKHFIYQQEYKANHKDSYDNMPTHVVKFAWCVHPCINSRHKENHHHPKQKSTRHSRVHPQDEHTFPALHLARYMYVVTLHLQNSFSLRPLRLNLIGKSVSRLISQPKRTHLRLSAAHYPMTPLLSASSAFRRRQS